MSQVSKEQLLIFSAAWNTVSLQRALSAFAILADIRQCGIDLELNFDSRRFNHESARKFHASLALLKKLYAHLSHRNGQRSNHFAVFSLAASVTDPEIVKAISLPKKSSETNELDPLQLSLFNLLSLCANPFEPFCAPHIFGRSNPYVLLSSQNSTSTNKDPWSLTECNNLFHWSSSILRHNKSNLSVAVELFSSLVEVMDKKSVFRTAARLSYPLRNESNVEEIRKQIIQFSSELVARSEHANGQTNSLQRVTTAGTDSLPPASLAHTYQYQLHLFAFEDVDEHWKELGTALGFLKAELDAIDKDLFHLSNRHKAWTMLQRYCDEHGSKDLDSFKAILHDVKIRTKSKKDEIPQMVSRSVIDDPRYVGRKAELVSIEEFFWEGNQSTAIVQHLARRKIQVICGMGGVGKTSLAFRYAVQYKLAYRDGIFHFNAESRSSLHVSLVQNLKILEVLLNEKFRFKRSSNFSEQMIYFTRYLREHRRALLIYDSADHLDWVEDAIPPSSVICHVIVTTRKSPEHLLEAVFKQPIDDIKVVDIIKLHHLEGENGTKALLVWAGKDPESYLTMSGENRRCADAIALKPPVEGLPIAIAHAGTFIRTHNMSFFTYWQFLVERVSELKAAALDLNKCLQYFRISHLKEQLWQAGVSEPDDLKSLNIDEFSCRRNDRALLVSAVNKLCKRDMAYLTWELDIDEVQRKSSEGYIVLSCCSVFSSRDIPHDLVERSSFSNSEKSVSQYYMSVGLSALNKFSLIQSTVQNDGLTRYNVHHLVQRSMIERCMENEEEFKALLLSVASCVSEILPDFDVVVQHLDPDSSLLAVSSHLYSIAKSMLLCGMLSETYPGLIDYGCVVALAFQHLQTAKELCSLRLANFRKLESQFKIAEKEQRNLRYSYDLGEAYKDHKCYEEAERYYSQAIRGNRPHELPTSELAQKWYVADRIAICRLRQGAHQEAEKLFLCVLNALLSTGSDLKHVSTVQNNLAAVYKTTGQLHQLHALLEKSLVVRRSAISLDALGLAQTLANLGLCLFELGNHSKAINCFQEALKIQRSSLPRDDMRIAKSLRHMGGCYAARGQHEQNKNLTKEAFEIAQASLDPDDPGFAYYLHDYGFALVKIGKFSDGIQLLKRSLALWKQQSPLPEFNRAIAKNLNFLGFALEETGRISEALQCYSECLELQEKIHHCKHPDLISTMNNIGLIYCNSGQVVKARPFLQDAFDICKRSLPRGHPQTCAAAQNLGYCFVSLGLCKNAQQIAKEMIEIFSSVSPVNDAMVQCFQQLLVRAAATSQFEI